MALWHVRVRPSNQMVKAFMMHFQHHKCDVQFVTCLESSLVETKGFRRCLRRDRHTPTSPPTQEKHLEPPVEFQEGLSWENSFRKPQHNTSKNVTNALQLLHANSPKSMQQSQSSTRKGTLGYLGCLLTSTNKAL